MGGQPVSYAVRNDGLGWRTVSSPGDCADDEIWSATQPIVQPAPMAAPQVVARRQALLALLAAGKLDAVDAAIQAAPRAVQIAWGAAGTFERACPLIDALAPTLGLTSTQIDNLFIEAATL